uniref:PX domain-containing protein n=1 Tax=Panagrellus redivivus TaxID=6233 RepID=A0A7E4VHH2_PANRE
MLFGATKPTRQPVRGTKRRHKPSQSEEPANKYAAIQDASASNSGNPQPPRLRRKPWYLCMPDERKFTCAAVTNEVTQGLLHIFIRHHQQLEHYVPMLRRLRLQLPREVKTLLRSIGRAVNMEAAEEDVSKFRAHIYNGMESL